MPGYHSEKWKRCVEHLKDKGYTGKSPYAICTASVGAGKGKKGKKGRRKKREMGWSQMGRRL